MPNQTKIFRVFVSSTFSDMKEERRILQNDVFPKLEKYCEERGAKFQAVDLRWGVNEESQLNQKTIDICLNEISRCQKLSPKPNFLVLVGNKYGWQPIPPRIPEEEMVQILSMLSGSNLELIQKWYKLDTNAIPAEYVLLPRNKEDRKYPEWRKVEKMIRITLREAVDHLKFSDIQRVKYFTSATHQEIIRGALSPPEDGENPEDHVVAMVRNIKDFPEGAVEGFVDVVDETTDAYSKSQLADLKIELDRKLGNHCIPYEATWVNDKSRIDDKTTFANDVFESLIKIIKQRINKVANLDDKEREFRLHEDFKEVLTHFFRGREGTLETIHQYFTGPEGNVMSLIGKSGSGKSSVMAEATRQIEEKYPGAIVVYRFIGATSASANIISLLTGICGQIAREFDVTLESLTGEGREKSLYEINGLTELLNKCLALGNEQKPVILFLDALDQLSDTDNARSLFWIPMKLPSHVKLIVSSLPELEEALKQTFLHHLPVLPEAEARQILDQWFNSINRKLTTEQYEEVINSCTKSGMPIYLKLAYEISREWHSWDADFLLKDDVKDIINHYFDQLQVEHTEEFLEHAISYMLCGRYQGLAENEILEVLAFDEKYWQHFLDHSHKEHKQELIELKAKLEDPKRESRGFMKIPIAVWSRLYLDLEPFLTERDADGVPIITFFHRQFNEVLRERYGFGKADSS